MDAQERDQEGEEERGMSLTLEKEKRKLGRSIV